MLARYLARNAHSDERFSFLDGPITANNPMGVHHAWGRTYKDLYQRYQTMLGKRQRYQNGFDCQGLWIEVEVERELGFKNKRDIERYGIDRFVERCKERVGRFATLITEQSQRLGMWMRWDDSYYTNSDENNYAIWSFLKRCDDRGLIYKGRDVMPWCPRCGTGLSNAEVAEGYRELSHLSLTLRYPITTPGHEGESLLVWTTTPWTLSSNVAAAVHPDLVYQLVAGDGGQRWWVSRGSKPRVAARAEILREADGSELIGLAYAGAFDELSAAAGVEHRVIGWDEVSDEEGTGIVHIAPGCGQEDFALAREHGLAVLDPIDDSGIFREGYGWQTGRYAGRTADPSDDLAATVADDLRAKGLLVAGEQYGHHYPVCWRCGTELLFHLVDEWFIAMEPLRGEIAAATREVQWLPRGIGLEERELDWLRNMGDWMISKKRYYGLALPIWVCGDCRAHEVIGSREDLRERAVSGWERFEGHTPHRPWIDQVEIGCTRCGGTARRIADVGNPWLDAGIVPFSTLTDGDPAEHARWFPADFVTESFPGQFRNWFYSLLTMSTVLAGRAPMKVLFGYALVRDEHGEEMHKSKGNAIWFDDAADRIGADVMRWMYASANPATNLNFGYGPASEVVRRFFLPLWNTYSFFVTYARLDGWLPSSTPAAVPGGTLLDRWILSRLDSLTGEVGRCLDAYDAAGATRAVERFVEQLSNWYIRRNRRRFWKGQLDDDKAAAYATLHTTLTTLARLVAPIVPHLADSLWENLVAGVTRQAPDSVHLTDFPSPVAGRSDPEVDRAVEVAQRIVALGRSARAAAGLKVRQPIAALRVKLPTDSEAGLSRDPATAAELVSQVLEELNAKRIEFLDDESELVERSLRPLLPVVGPRRGPAVADIMRAARAGAWTLLADRRAEIAGLCLEPDEFELVARRREGYEVAAEDDLIVALDTQLTPELVAEGVTREVAHRLQAMRRAAGYQISDRIAVAIAGDHALLEMLAPRREWLAAETLATELALAPDAALDGADRQEAARLPEGELRLAVRRSR